MIKIEDTTEVTTSKFVTITLDQDDAIRLMHVCGRMAGYRQHPIRLMTNKIYRHIYDRFIVSYESPLNRGKDDIIGTIRVEAP